MVISIGLTSNTIKVKMCIKDNNRGSRGWHVDTLFSPTHSRSWHTFNQGILVRLVLIQEVEVEVEVWEVFENSPLGAVHPFGKNGLGETQLLLVAFFGSFVNFHCLSLSLLPLHF